MKKKKTTTTMTTVDENLLHYSRTQMFQKNLKIVNYHETIMKNHEKKTTMKTKNAI